MCIHVCIHMYVYNMYIQVATDSGTGMCFCDMYSYTSVCIYRHTRVYMYTYMCR